MKRYKILLIVFSSLVFNVNAQTWQWAKQAGSTSDDHVQDLCADPNGDVYIIGKFSIPGQLTGYMIFDNDTVWNNGINQMFLVKYSALGSVLWVKSIGGNNTNLGGNCSNCEDAERIIYDGFSNSLYMTGVFSGTATFGTSQLVGYNDLFLAKIDLNGNFTWVKKINSNLAINSQSITLDPFGNIYICGSASDSAYFDTISIPKGQFIAEYTSNGNILWAKRKLINTGIQKLIYANNALFALGITWSDTAYIDTITFISGTNPQMFFSRFDLLGNVIWSKFATSSVNLFPDDMSKDGNDNFYVTGYFQTDADFSGTTILNSNTGDMFFAKYNANGGIIWVRQANSSNSAGGGSLSTLTDGSTYVEGIFTGNATFGSYSITSSSNGACFIARYDNNGGCLGVIQFGPVSPPVKVVSDISNNCFAAGDFSSAINIGSFSLSPIYADDVFLAKHDLITGIGEVHRSNSNQLIINANPNAGKCNITVPDEFLHEQNLTLSIFDNTGKLIQQKTMQMNDGKIKLNLEAEAKGIYNVTLSNGTKSYSGKIVFE